MKKDIKFPVKRETRRTEIKLVREPQDPTERPMTDQELQDRMTPYWKAAARVAKLKS